MNRILGFSIALSAVASVHAQEIAPNANLRAEGIPSIPAALARQAALYTEFRPRSVVSWHPGRREQPTLDISLLDPLAPERTRKIATLPGTGWGDFSFSFDDRRLAALEFRSVTDASVWLIDVASGMRQRVLPADGQLKVGIAQ